LQEEGERENFPRGKEIKEEKSSLSGDKIKEV
jgi:hypothetical protein